jgi:hypothetical protein
MQGDKKMEGMFSWPSLTVFGNASFLLTDFHYFHQNDYKGSRPYSNDRYQPSQKMSCCTGPHSLWFLGSPHCTSFWSMLVQSCLHSVCPFHYDPFTLMSMTRYLLFWFVKLMFGHIWSTDLQFLVWDLSAWTFSFQWLARATELSPPYSTSCVAK